MRRVVLVLLLVVCTAGIGVFGYTYLHPFNRYRRAAMGWVAEHNAIVEASLSLIEEYDERGSADGLTDAYQDQVLDRWVALQSEVEAYEAPPQLAESHALLLLAIQEQTVAATALVEEPGTGAYAAHLELALQAMDEYPGVFERERRAWIGK